LHRPITLAHITARLFHQRGDVLALLIKPAAGIGFYRVAVGPQQAINGELGHFPSNVPQRNVNATNGMHHNAAPAVLARALEHLLPEIFEAQRVLSQEQRLEFVLDHYLCARQRSSGRAGLTNAYQTSVRFHFYQQGIARRLDTSSTHIGGLATVREWDRADIGNVHSYLLGLNWRRSEARAGSTSGRQRY